MNSEDFNGQRIEQRDGSTRPLIRSLMGKAQVGNGAQRIFNRALVQGYLPFVSVDFITEGKVSNINIALHPDEAVELAARIIGQVRPETALANPDLRAYIVRLAAMIDPA
jgi:hypothetical protein